MKERQVNQIIISEEAQTRLRLGQCPSCAKPKNEWTRRRDWTCCSGECTWKYNKEMVVYGWQDLRYKAQIRDGGKCIQCGSTERLEGDHIKPISLGGEEFDINNVQTLCHLCHKAKTREDIKAIAVRRRVEKHLSRGQLQLN